MLTVSQLAGAHGLSPQSVRNYEEWGILPPADRTDGGHRRYGARHATALSAFLALAPAIGHAGAREVLSVAGLGDTPLLLTLLDEAHAQLARDRATVDTVASALAALSREPAASAVGGNGPVGELTIGEVARRVGLTTATLRAWERMGIVAPARDRAGHRCYRPDDVRDVDLAHLLRRGGHPLTEVALVLGEVRRAGGTEVLGERVTRWRAAIVQRGTSLLRGQALLWEHLEVLARGQRAASGDGATAAPEDGRRG